MFKKIISSVALMALVFGVAPKTNIAKNLANVCSYVCCDHDGAGWDN